ncbi:MAG: rubrerythrin family protein [Halobacteriaceae archaeon]
MAASYVDAVADAAATELDRLGSSQYLVAVTGAALEPPQVLAAVVEERYHGWQTFDRWADDTADERAAQSFVAAAERERQARGKLSAELQSFGVTHSPSAEPGAMQAYLRTVEGPVERVAAGLVGSLLVTDRTLLQYVSFFVNEGDERRADILRTAREEIARGREMGDWLLAEGLDADVSEGRVVEAATPAIEAAYGEYVERLDDLGLDPRPVC